MTNPQRRNAMSPANLGKAALAICRQLQRAFLILLLSSYCAPLPAAVLAPTTTALSVASFLKGDPRYTKPSTVRLFKEFMSQTNWAIDVEFEDREEVLPGALGRQPPSLYIPTSSAIHAITQAGAFLWIQSSNWIAGRWQGHSWDIVPTSQSTRVTLEYQDSLADATVRGPASTMGPIGTERELRRGSMRDISQLGVLDARPGSIKWNGNDFVAEPEGGSGGISGHLTVSNGTPAELDVTESHGRTKLLSPITYSYTGPLKLPFVPNRIMTRRFLNGQGLTTSSVWVRSIQTISAPYAMSTFSPQQYIEPFGTNVITIVYSNGWPYERTGSPGVLRKLFVAPNPLAVQVQQARKARQALVRMSLALFLCLLMGFWWYQARRTRRNEGQK